MNVSSVISYIARKNVRNDDMAEVKRILVARNNLSAEIDELYNGFLDYVENKQFVVSEILILNNRVKQLYERLNGFQNNLKLFKEKVASYLPSEIEDIWGKEEEEFFKLKKILLDRIALIDSVTLNETFDATEIKNTFFDELTLMNGMPQRREHFTLQVSNKPIWLKGNKLFIISLICNLVANAFNSLPRYSGKQKIMIDIREEKGEAVITVSDNGKGMTKEEIEKLWHPFYTTGGIGIGTTEVQLIVKDHGGTIDVQSEVGKGTTFTVRLPIAPEIIQIKTIPKELLGKKMTTADKVGDKEMATFREIPASSLGFINSVKKSFTDGYISLDEKQQAALNELAEEVTVAGEITFLPEDYPNADYWNSMMSEYRNWRDNIPIILAHLFTHHRIMAIVNYWNNKEDFYAGLKVPATEKVMAKFSDNLDRIETVVKAKNIEDQLRTFVYNSLGGNIGDMSVAISEQKDILSNDIEETAQLFSKGIKSVDFFVDNTAGELLADLLLIWFMLDNNIVEKTTLHVKPHPLLVSDVLKADVFDILERLKALPDDRAKRIGRALEEHISSGRLIIKEDKWVVDGTERVKFPREEEEELKKSDLIILKGDYMYRAFCGNYYYPYDASINDTVKDFELPPILFLRIMKVEMAVGIEKEKIRAVEEKSQEWWKQGYGLIQLSEDNRKDRKEREEIDVLKAEDSPFDIVESLMKDIEPTEIRWGDSWWEKIAPVKEKSGDNVVDGWLTVFRGGPNTPMENTYEINALSGVRLEKGKVFKDYDEFDRDRVALYVKALKEAFENYEEIQALAEEERRKEQRDIEEFIPVHTEWESDFFKQRKLSLKALASKNRKIKGVAKDEVSLKTFFEVVTEVYRVFTGKEDIEITSFDEIYNSQYSNDILLKKKLLIYEEYQDIRNNPDKVFIDIKGYQGLTGNDKEFLMWSMLSFVDDTKDSDSIRVKVEPRYIDALFKNINEFFRVFDRLVALGIPVSFPEGFEKVFLGRYNAKARKDISKYPTFLNKQIIEANVNREKEWGQTFIDTALEQAYEAKKLNQNIIVGIDISMIPEEQMPYIQGLLSKLSRLSKERGLDNLLIRRKKGAKLATVIRNLAAKTGTPDSNIILLGDHNVLDKRAFDTFRDGINPDEWAVFAGIELPENMPDNNYLRMLEMLTKAMNLWAGKPQPEDTKYLQIIQEGKRFYKFIVPEIEPMDYELLKEIYKSQMRAMKSA